METAKQETTAPKTTEYKYEYQQYKSVEEYKAPEYWTPSYEAIQEKYSAEKYEEKQYLPQTSKAGDGKKTADYLVGNEQENVVKTYESDDVVEGGYGNDKIDAGEGDDLIWGISPKHNAEDKKYTQPEYMEVDWLTGNAGQDIYAIGTEKYAHYATNGDQDYAVIKDYKIGEDAVMLHGTPENYVVGETATKTPSMEAETMEPKMEPKAAGIYWDKDQTGSYSTGDDLVAVLEGYTVEELTTAKDSFVYVTSEVPMA
ncbi:MAG: hypothetical protein AAGA16_18620 [Cyanobacteria bacterium P01_E01_bin.35]